MADIAILLERNLQEIFGEVDDALRHKVAEEIMHDDAIFVEPHGTYRGREEIVRIAGIIRATHPTFKYTPIGQADVLHEQAGRMRWVAGAPGAPPAYAGTDFIIGHDGKIAAIYLFFDGQRAPSGTALGKRDFGCALTAAALLSCLSRVSISGSISLR